MLISGYRKEMIWSQCNSRKGCLRCLAHLDEEISGVIPYLNAILGGYQYLSDPLAVTLKLDGKLVTVYANRIAINNLTDETEADLILEWLKDKINDTWTRRDEFKPCYEPTRRPSVVEVLKTLRDVDCRLCGETSCVAYAVRLVEGSIDPATCPHLLGDKSQKLTGFFRPAGRNDLQEVLDYRNAE